MATLKQTHDGDHYYILAGPSQGTQQITPDGLKWLSQHLKHLPQKGKDSPIDTDTYRYLKNNRYLFIKEIAYEKSFAFSTPSHQIEDAEPALLLCLNDTKGEIGDPWTLRIRSRQDGLFLLCGVHEASGLRDDWQGNVFFAYEHAELTNAWQRRLPNSSVPLNNSQEVYWLAKKEYEPEWPGWEQRVGDTKDDWQLWHLCIKTDIAPLEIVAQWLTYRSIQLIYPQWRLRALSTPGFSFPITDGDTTEYVLLRCDPPNQRREDEDARVSLQGMLSSTATTGDKSAIESLLLSNDGVNYLLFSVPDVEQEYCIRVKGEANGQPLYLRKYVQGQQEWLQGLCCMLTTASIQYTLDAFVGEQDRSKSPYEFSVPDAFSLNELVDLNWDWQPSDIPCSLQWKYPSLAGKMCQGTTPSVSPNTLNMLWQEQVWPEVSQSSWVQFTLDAAAFGNVSLKVVLKPEMTTSQTWRNQSHYETTLLWLGRQAMQDTPGPQQSVPPTLRKALQQFDWPAMPPELKSVLQFLSSRHHLPTWIVVRLQYLLAGSLLES